MFSGIIEESAKVAALTLKGELGRLRIDSALDHSQTRPGDSIAIDGVCLTVTAKDGNILEFDVGSETLRRSTLGELNTGAPVNLERALKLGGRLHGHIVTGHIDAAVTLLARSSEGPTEKFVWEITSNLRPLIAEKGSVAIAGISLTVGEVSASSFAVYIIPHTASVTTLFSYRPGQKANIEADILARYVQTNLAPQRDEALMKKLAESGFITGINQ